MIKFNKVLSVTANSTVFVTTSVAGRNGKELGTKRLGSIVATDQKGGTRLLIDSGFTESKLVAINNATKNVATGNLDGVSWLE